MNAVTGAEAGSQYDRISDSNSSARGLDSAVRMGMAPDPVVQLTHVSRVFAGNPDVHAVRPCTLSIHRGDFVTVIGPSGSGKSTLLNLLGLLDRPSAGTYRLAGQDTSSMSDAERTRLRGRTIGFVFQSFHLLGHRSAIENVQMSLIYRGVAERARRDRAHEALHAVGLSHRAQFQPNRLSGGERQRVAIARALAGRPSILLCDEPTGNLDSANSAAVLDLFTELNTMGTTIVLITHDPEVAGRGNRQLSVRDGVVRSHA